MNQRLLEVGCGKRPQPGWINTDYKPGPGVDLVFDACKPWPIDANSIDFIRLNHTLEHLPDPFAAMAEAWRVLKPEPNPRTPNMLVVVPHGASDASLADPTHMRPYLPGTFASFQHGYNDAVYNPQHDQWQAPFDVLMVFEHINPDLRWLLTPLTRRWGFKCLSHLWNAYTEIRVHMRALKTDGDRTRFGITKQANAIPIAPFLYQHEYEKRPLNDNEKLKMKFFGPYAKELQSMFEEAN